MEDDPAKRGIDRNRINANQDYEVHYWTQKLGVSRDELIKAVERAGPMVDNVARALGKQA